MVYFVLFFGWCIFWVGKGKNIWILCGVGDLFDMGYFVFLCFLFGVVGGGGVYIVVFRGGVVKFGFYKSKSISYKRK